MHSKAKGVYKRKLRRGNGLETRVDYLATFMLILFVFFSISSLLTFSVPGIIACFASLMSGFFQWLILRCVAEHLRIQKMIADLPYEGKITGPVEEELWCCSNCGYTLASTTTCAGCGAELES